MTIRNRLPLIFLIPSFILMVFTGTGLFLWLDAVKDSETRQLHGNLENGAGRIPSEIALEFSVIAALFSYAVEDADKIRWEMICTVMVQETMQKT